MALYDDFPYTNFHSLNLDWIVKKLSELENGESTTEESSSTATLARNLSGNYPYTNFHSLNLDWIIRSMFELESGFETVENEWQGLRAAGLLNDEVKNAILQCFQNVAWVNDQGQQYYNALHDLFFPPVIVDTLTAVLDQGERVFHTGEDVNVIKNYLTVTAKLTDGTLITVPSTQYILTGSLSQEGPNIITVTYMNASTSITVNAVAVSLVSISAVYTQSGTVYTIDTLDSLKSDLVVMATYSDSSTATVPSADYTLSGTLTEGTSTITVTYEGLTATFNVTVTETYSALTYVEATGTQYINTGFIPNPNTKIVIDYMSNKASGETFQCLIGAVSDTGTTADGRTFFMYIASANGLTASVAETGSVKNTGVTIAKDSRNTYELSISDISVDGTSYGIPRANTSAVALTQSVGVPLYVFARNHGSTLARALASGRVYELSIYLNDVLVNHYVPVQRNTDNKVGLYDSINDVFHALEVAE